MCPPTSRSCPPTFPHSDELFARAVSQSKLSCLHCYCPVFITAARKVPSTGSDRDAHSNRCQPRLKSAGIQEASEAAVQERCPIRMVWKDQREAAKQIRVGCEFKDGKACKKKKYQTNNGETLRIAQCLFQSPNYTG